MSESAAPQFDRVTIRDLLRQLGERLARRGVTGELYIIGGAAVALAYDARRSTRDLDAVWLPHEPLPGRSMLVLADLFEDLGSALPLG